MLTLTVWEAFTYRGARCFLSVTRWHKDFNWPLQSLGGDACGRWAVLINHDSVNWLSTTEFSPFSPRVMLTLFLSFRSSGLTCWWTADSTRSRNATANSTLCIKWWDLARAPGLQSFISNFLTSSELVFKSVIFGKWESHSLQTNLCKIHWQPVE